MGSPSSGVITGFAAKRGKYWTRRQAAILLGSPSGDFAASPSGDFAGLAKR